jgi:tetratricopeptide (TPR) repeat protein
MGEYQFMFREANHQGKKVGRAIRILVLAISLLALCGSTIGNAETQSFDQLAARAQGAMEANQIPQAILLYQRAIALRPIWSEGWWYLGTMFFDANQLDKARDAFLHFVAVEHEQPGPGFGMLGLTEFKLRDYRRALAALERGRALGLGTNTAFVQKALYEDGILQNLFGQPEIALVRLTLIANQIAAAHPDMPEDAVLSDTDLLSGFGLAALRIPKLPNEIPSSRANLIQRAGHAQALVALQDRTAAGQEMQQLVAQYPSQPNIHYMYGVYLLKEDPPSAMRQFREELAVSPKSAVARIQLAFEFLRVGKYQQGLRYAREAVALVPDNFAAHVACGELWLEIGNTDSAIRELRIAVKESPGSPDAHYALSRALTAAGRSSEAAKQRAEFGRLKALSTQADR